MGVSNLSGDRNIGKDVGSSCSIRLDFPKGLITYTTRHGVREAPLRHEAGTLLYPAVDSDENGSYQIERVGGSSGGGGGPVMLSDKVAAFVANVGLDSTDRIEDTATA